MSDDLWPRRSIHGLRFDEPDVPVFKLPVKPIKHMSLLNLDLGHKTPAKKVDMGQTHITAMTGNATFPAATRVPTDAQVLAAQNKLSAAINAADAAQVIWKQKNAERDQAESEWDTAITARANNCESITPGDVAALTSTGLPMKGAVATPGGAMVLGAPQNLRATMGDMNGDIDLMWDRLKGSSTNVIDYREQGTTPWIQAGMVQQSKFMVTGLTSGKTYEFRVHGVGKDGAGPFSDPAVKMAP